MAVCRTRMEAAELLVKFRNEGLKDIETTDSTGQILDESELTEPPEPWEEEPQR